MRTLSKRGKARIDVRIRRISLGNFGDTKSVGKGVSELRMDFDPGYRIYFVQKQNIVVILLCGCDKSSQESDISRAHVIAQSLKDEL